MSLLHEPIVVTGMGAVSAAGTGVEALWRAALDAEARTSCRRVDQIDWPVYAVPDLPPPIAQERVARPADRTVWLALAAAREAAHMARLDTVADRSRIALFIGSSRGPCGRFVEATERASKRPTDSVYSAFASISGAVAHILDIGGSAGMFSATCASGALALRSALQALQTGEVDYALVGGVDAPLVDTLLREFAAVGVMSRDALRPFDRSRTGTVLGEGAAFIVLERGDTARERCARTFGEIANVALGTEASHRAGGGNSAARMASALERVLYAGRIRRTEVDLVHLHGTGTQVNDANESRAVEQVFGGRHAPLAWGSKGSTGHVLGASALFQVVLSLRAMQASSVPGTVHLRELDPACNRLRLSAKTVDQVPIGVALCLTSGFWGNISCIGLRAPAPGYSSPS